MERDLNLKFTVPSHDEIEARLRQAQELRSQTLAQGVKWLVRQVNAGLYWLFGLEWGDAERRRKDELNLRYQRAATPAHVEPHAAPSATAQAQPGAVTGRRAARAKAEDDRRAA